jgi:hypothetical protein
MFPDGMIPAPPVSVGKLPLLGSILVQAYKVLKLILVNSRHVTELCYR